jgi:hypothetical protein
MKIQALTDLTHAPWLATGKQISRGFQAGMPPWSQGTGSCPAREGEAGSLDGIEAGFARGKAKLFPLRVDCQPQKRGKRRPVGRTEASDLMILGNPIGTDPAA